jgi:L-threonylcarbamoyladenylate synthase
MRYLDGQSMSYVTRHFDEKVVALLKNGAVGFMPSDTIYGFSCATRSKEAVEQVYDLKKRNTAKPLIVLISDIFQLHELGIDSAEARPALKHWPAPLTVIFEVDKLCPEYLHRGGRTLAVRLPRDPELRHLISQTGPLVSSIANQAGGEPINDVPAAQKVFGAAIGFYVDQGLRFGRPTTVVKIEGGRLVVTREGSYRLNH